MNLDQIATKCFILALFIRDDGQRLLLGDGYYDFNQKLQHFQANTIANDVVEIQGDNGQLLAGQVMRSGAQKFEGYIGDATTNRQTIEQKRSDFMAFFRIKHFYKVIYIFPDGTAIQRQRGYLTDAPTIPEIFQKFPEYSVALNFEDANYYEYAEDDHGDEIYAHIAELALAGEAIGGLIWDEIGAVTNGITWSGIQTAQGEYISITNELDIPVKLASVEMLGNAEQTTYSGKNLCSRGYYESTATARFEVNKSTLQQTFTISYISDVTAGNATIYLFTDGTNRGSVGVTIQQTAGTRRSATITLDATNWGYVQNATAIRLTAYLGNAGHTTDATITQAMVENGSSMTAYEPYVGGTASPNPDYPQPISVVAGENVVKIEGKNLCPDTSEGYWVGSAGTNAGRTANDSGVAIPVQPNTYYTVSTTTTQARYRCAWSDSTTIIGGASLATASFFSADNTSGSHTGSSGSHEYLIINATDLSAIQFELGSTATDYEPYQGQEFEVNLGKNLIYTGDRTNQGITFAYNATTGETSVSGTASTTYANALQISEYLPAGTYTLSIQDTLPFTVGIGTRNSANTRTPHGITAGNKTLTFTLTEPAFSYDVYLTALTSGSQINSTFKLQCEKGSSVSSFAPYFTPIELAKIGNYQDRIYKEDSKWYIEKQVGKVVLDGTETWTTASTNISGRVRTRTTAIASLVKRPASGNVAGDAISSHFVIATSGRNWEGDQSFCIETNGNMSFYADGTQTQSVSNWTSWLATNPTIVYYALATPTTTEITNEELIAQLDTLGASSLYLGLNNIGTETPNAMPTLKIEYYTEYTLEGAGYEWEPGGNTAKTIVTVAGVDSAWPIWTIQGGAQNPTLTNITTGQTISWQGFVPEGQTLTINMAEMTADLAGANVFEYITGEWLRLAPGNNTLVYNAGNADKPSTLSWNGVLA